MVKAFQWLRWFGRSVTHTTRSERHAGAQVPWCLGSFRIVSPRICRSLFLDCVLKAVGLRFKVQGSLIVNATICVTCTEHWNLVTQQPHGASKDSTQVLWVPLFYCLICCLLLILFCKAICSAIGFVMCDINKAEIDIDIDKRVKKKYKKVSNYVRGATYSKTGDRFGLWLQV